MARLRVFPSSIRYLRIVAAKMVESAGNAPASACLQGRCLACRPRPRSGISNLRFEIAKWHAALVLPQARRVLETQLRKLARGMF